MPRTYKAVLHGDRVEWIDTPPARSLAIPVQIVLLESAPEALDSDRGRRMAEALEELARGGAFAHIEDPVRWQREARRDPALPGREP
jgi:hypothetical protein